MVQNKILHRDMKAANLLISNSGSLQIADFGLAKVIDKYTLLRVRSCVLIVFITRGQSDGARQTMCGTPSYLAPEVVNPVNDHGYDHLVDSWSVGVIVFCMCVSIKARVCAILTVYQAH